MSAPPSVGADIATARALAKTRHDMNPQLNYYLAQARTANLIREGQHRRIAGAAPHRKHRPRPTIRRIIDSVTQRRTTSLPTGGTHR